MGGKVLTVRIALLLSILLLTLKLLHDNRWIRGMVMDVVYRHSEKMNELDGHDQQHQQQQSGLLGTEKNGTVDESQIVNEGLEWPDRYSSSSNSSSSNGNECNTEYRLNLADVDIVKRQQDATVKLLYKNSQEQQYWLNQPPLTIYIYDNMPSDYTDYQNVSECINSRFGLKETGWVSELNNCLWNPTVCSDSSATNDAKHQKLLMYRYNYNSDVSYLKRLQEYPFRTCNPSEADIFVVPYPHKSHCLCNIDFTSFNARCKTPYDEIVSNVMDNLVYKNKSTAARHLYLHGADDGQQLKPFRHATIDGISISLGPSNHCQKKNNELCGQMPVPYVTTDSRYQPRPVAERSDEWWTERPRLQGIGTMIGLSNSKFFTLRRELFKNWKYLVGESMRNGLPNKVVSLEGRTPPPQHAIMEFYKNTTFCPILPGDGSAQKRFFDVILNGCIPVVPEFPSSEDNVTSSFHRIYGASTRITYPFSVGNYIHDTTAGIDIKDIVVTFNGTCGIGCMKEPLEQLLADSDQLRKKRLNLKAYAQLSTFGLSRDTTLSYPDAFSATMVTMRHYVWSLTGRRQQTTI